MPQVDDFDDDEEFPVLTDVVKEGNPAFIQAARQAQKEIDKAVSDEIDLSPLTPADISRSITAPQQEFENQPFAAQRGTQLQLTEAQLEQLIDEIVDRHAKEMRNELHTILKHRE